MTYDVKPQSRVAVVGGGVAGIVAAYLISKKHSVTLFESDKRLGGHTNTVILKSGPDAGLGIDTGFIVLNDQTYPCFHKFLAALEVPVRYANMSFSFYCERSALAYGSLDLGMLFAQRKNLFSPSFLKMLWDMRRFWISARQELSSPAIKDLTLKDFLKKHKLMGAVVENYLIPIGGAIWSTSKSGMEEFPAETFLRFFEKHGLLGILNQPRWQTVVNGSQSYLEAFKKTFKGTLKIGERVKSITRGENTITVGTENAPSQEFDHVVIATHADISLKLLSDPTPAEVEILSPWSYQLNKTFLHTDTSFLPPEPRALASWNYRRELGELGNEPVSVTYHMNSLQGITSKTNYCVTLNPRRSIPKDKIIEEIDYYHPMYTKESLASQKQLSRLQGDRGLWYCGSYFGFGFHEDAVRSSVNVAKMFGVDL